MVQRQMLINLERKHLYLNLYSAHRHLMYSVCVCLSQKEQNGPPFFVPKMSSVDWINTSSQDWCYQKSRKAGKSVNSTVIPTAE